MLLLANLDENERALYENEYENSNCSVRALEMRIDYTLYKRLLLLKGLSKVFMSDYVKGFNEFIFMKGEDRVLSNHHTVCDDLTYPHY